MRAVEPGADEERPVPVFLEQRDRLGGDDTLSEGQKSLARRAATMQLQLELLEQRFAQSVDGTASRDGLETYQRVTNTLRRTLESLNLHKGRKPAEITLEDVLREYRSPRDEPDAGDAENGPGGT